jgi:MFS family permease
MREVVPESTSRVGLSALLTSYGAAHFSVVLVMIALPWFVLETTGSAARTGIAAAVNGLPMIVAGIFGGVIVDRLGYRRTVIISDAFSGLAFGMIPLLHLTTGITFWQLLVFVFLGSVFDTPAFTARVSLMPDMAERAGTRLERANSISQTISQSTVLAAPALTGIFIGIVGASAVLWIATVMFWVSTVVVWLLVPAPAPSARAAVQAQARYLGELKRGVSFVFGSGLIVALILTISLIQFVRANLMVILPVYAHQYFGRAADFGFMFAAMGSGGLVSALLYGFLAHRLPRWPIIALGVFSPVLAFLVLAATPPYWFLLCGLAAVGFMSGALLPLVVTLMQESIPPDLRGRVFGLYDAGMFSVMVPGRLLAGFLIEWTGIVQTLVMVGSAYLIATLALATNPHLRNLPDPRQHAATDSPTAAERDPEPEAQHSGR